MRGVVERLMPGGGGRVLAEDGRIYTFAATALTASEAARLRPGCSVEFTSVEGHGQRLTSLKLASAGHGGVPRAGDASGAGTGRALGMDPPAGVLGDVVAEASWQSFPASDPPAW